MTSLGPQKRESSTSRIQWIAAVLIAYVGGVQTVLLYTNSAQVVNSDPESAMMMAPPTTSVTGIDPLVDTKYRLAYEQSYGFFDDIDEYNWKLMQTRARTRINHKFDSSLKFYEEPARWYMNNFEPDFTCPQERRVGGVGDGPKWVCDPHRLPKIVQQRTKTLGDPKKAGCLIYSVGSGGKWQFEDGIFDMFGSLCEIHVFDPGNWAKDRSDLEARNVHFHKWGFRSSYDDGYKPVTKYGEYFSVNETLTKLGHDGRTIDIFKIDCEFCEWHCFRDWFDVDIRLLLVETHSLPENRQTALNFFYGFQKANFFLYHKEPNIHPKAKGEGIEWAYIRLSPDFMTNKTDNVRT